MNKFGKVLFASAIVVSAIGPAIFSPTAQAAEEQGTISSFVKDNGGTISLKLVNNSDSYTFSKVYVQELRDGQWTEPDYDVKSLELYPDVGWNYDTLYYLKGNGGELPSKGTFRFKIVTDNAGTGQYLETAYSETFTIN